MGWKETCAVEERMRFMVAVEKQEESFAAICRRFGVSRRVGYKWLARFEEEGAAGLFDRSRAPLHHPQAIADRIAERCLAARRAHPTWGRAHARAINGLQTPPTTPRTVATRAVCSPFSFTGSNNCAPVALNHQSGFDFRHRAKSF